MPRAIEKIVFVSFDWKTDKHYRFLLTAWNENPRFDFDFVDGSSAEIRSWNISRIKGALTAKIKQATHTVVIVGSNANKLHPDHEEIGYRNWLNFEIAQSKANGNALVAVKIDRTFTSPQELLGAGATWAMSFTADAIKAALDDA